MFGFLTKKFFSVYIFYGSQHGYAESVARHLYTQIKKDINPFVLKIAELNDILSYKIHKDDFVIILLSTTGDGEFPDNSIKLYRFLRKHKDKMDNINYSLLGFGDSNYRSFCHSSKVLDRRLHRLGATKFKETVFNDDAINDSEIIDKWIDDMIVYLKNYKSSMIKWFVKSMSNKIK